MNMSTRQLHAFLTLCEDLNFSRAALRLHMTQAALSKSIAELESHCGARLFDRTSRTVSLTESGRVFRLAAEQAMTTLSSSIADIQVQQGSRVQQYKVGCAPMLAAHVLPSVIRRLFDAEPDTAIVLMEGTPLELQDALHRGDVDVAYATVPANIPGVHQVKVADGTLVLVCPASTTPPPKAFTIEDIANHSLIAVYPDSAAQRFVDYEMRSGGIVPKRRLQVHHMQTAIALVEQGLGVAILPSYFAAAWRRYDVYSAPLKPATPFHLCALYRSGSEVKATLRNLNDEIAAAVRGTDFAN